MTDIWWWWWWRGKTMHFFFVRPMKACVPIMDIVPCTRQLFTGWVFSYIPRLLYPWERCSTITHWVGLAGRQIRTGEEEEMLSPSVPNNIFRDRSARLCLLFKLNGTRKHEWRLRQSLNTAANYGKNRQSEFCEWSDGTFLGGGGHSQKCFIATGDFCADWI